MKIFTRYVMLIIVELCQSQWKRSIKINYEMHINLHDLYILTGVEVNQK